MQVFGMYWQLSDKYVVVLGWVTVCVRTGEVLPLAVLSPL